MASYRELTVWKKSVDLTLEVYRLCRFLPKEETYGLSDQMRRAAVSIPSNIAEGQARNAEKDFIRFLSIAQGSRAELETQIEICVQLGFLSTEQTLSANALSEEIGKMIRTLIKRIRQSSSSSGDQNELPTTNY